MTTSPPIKIKMPSVELLGETVAGALRNEIVSGKLHSGMKLTEAHLSTQLNLSRQPIREAFSILQNEGLIIRIPRKGNFVSEISLRQLEEVYQIRAIMEGFAGRLLTGNATLEKISRLKSILKSIEKEDYGGSVHMLGQLNVRFHKEFVDTSDNSVLIKCYMNIIPLVKRYQSVGLDEPSLWKPSMKEHSKIVSVVESGTAELAEQICKEHVMKAQTRLLKHVVRLFQKSSQGEKEEKISETAPERPPGI